MQKRVGLIFLSKLNNKLLLILENSEWTVPTVIKRDTVLDDLRSLFVQYREGKIIPIELYTSQDNGFEYGTYICLVDEDFAIRSVDSYAWCMLENLPKNLHKGLKNTLNNRDVKIKINTILELANANFNQ